MRHNFLQRARDGEEGATLVILVLSLMALFGMMVLVVDVGGLLYTRRALVNGSDAAALAAAQSCAGTVDTDDPEVFADLNAAANLNGVVTAGPNITAMPGCDTGSSGYVSVEYGKDVRLFFAPVIGLETENAVRTAATAHWGPAGAASPVPVVFSNIQSSCQFPNPGVIGSTCPIWYSNKQLSGSSFGFLNFELWNVMKTESKCNNNYRIDDTITGVTPTGRLDLNYPDPTWVCAYSGNGVWPTFFGDWVNNSNPKVKRVFPVSGPTGSDQYGVWQPPPDNVNVYDIIGFVTLELTHVYDGADALGAQTACPPTLIPAVGTYDLKTFCGGGHPASSIIANTVKVKPNKDFSYDPATGIVTVTKADSARTVEFDYLQNGPCGPVPTDLKYNSGNDLHCLITTWRGHQVGGSNPGGGADFGTEAIALCDRDIGSCLDPSS
jgi:Flp pilus assembly protein TadG